MRSMLLVLALSAPSLAFAAPNYTTAINNVPSMLMAKPQFISMGFYNSTLDRCYIHVGESTYVVESFQRLRLNLPVGRIVAINSEMNSHVAQTVMPTTADADTQFMIRSIK